jgi:hypothetical protein
MHTTCLTKHKPKRNEEKQSKEKQKQVLPWRKTKQREAKTGRVVRYIYFFLFGLNSSMQNLWWGGLQTIKEKIIKHNNKGIPRTIKSNIGVSL